jgi:hypothetical protein
MMRNANTTGASEALLEPNPILTDLHPTFLALSLPNKTSVPSVFNIHIATFPFWRRIRSVAHIGGLPYSRGQKSVQFIPAGFSKSTGVARPP